MVQVFDHERLAEVGKGIVKLQLPDTKEIVAFKYTSGYADNDGTSWYAESFGQNGENDLQGSLHIVTSPDAPTIMGTVNYGDAFYEFMPVDKGHCVFYRVDNKGLADLGSCETEGAEIKPNSPLVKPELEFEKSNSQPCGRGDITILLMTSPAARAAIPANNINYVINTAVAQLKQSLANSYVSDENVNIKTVSPVEATNYLESGNIINDVGNLSNEFEDERQAANADLVVMFTGNSYSGNGLAEDIGPNPNAPYAIVEIQSATSKTFAHEVGHLLGGRHARDMTNSARGIVLNSCNPDRATVMCDGIDFLGNAEDRVLRFSTPVGSYCGSPTGDASHNVSSFFNNNGQTVANYIQNTGDFSFVAWVTGPWSMCPGQTATFYSNTRCGGGVSRVWHRSVNGGPFQYVSSAINYDNWFPLSTPSGTNYVVRLTATDGSGNVAISTKNGSVSNSACGGGWRPNIAEVENPHESISIVPNPVVGGDFIVNVPGGLTNGEISVLNANYRQVYRTSVNTGNQKVLHNISIREKLSSGFYFIRVWNAETNTVQIAKLIVK